MQDELYCKRQKVVKRKYISKEKVNPPPGHIEIERRNKSENRIHGRGQQ